MKELSEEAAALRSELKTVVEETQVDVRVFREEGLLLRCNPVTGRLEKIRTRSAPNRETRKKDDFAQRTAPSQTWAVSSSVREARPRVARNLSVAWIFRACLRTSCPPRHPLLGLSPSGPLRVGGQGAVRGGGSGGVESSRHGDEGQGRVRPRARMPGTGHSNQVQSFILTLPTVALRSAVGDVDCTWSTCVPGQSKEENALRPVPLLFALSTPCFLSRPGRVGGGKERRGASPTRICDPPQ